MIEEQSLLLIRTPPPRRVLRACTKPRDRAEGLKLQGPGTLHCQTLFLMVVHFSMGGLQLRWAAAGVQPAPSPSDATKHTTTTDWLRAGSWPRVLLLLFFSF